MRWTFFLCVALFLALQVTAVPKPSVKLMAALYKEYFTPTQQDNRPRNVLNPDTKNEIQLFGTYASLPNCPSSGQMNCGFKCNSFTQSGGMLINDIDTGENRVMIFYNPTNDQLVISFRGSASAENWKNNLQIEQVPFALPNWWIRDMKVHKGFLQTYASVRREIINAVRNELRRQNWNPNVRLVFTGHSLGGALANIAAMDFALSRYMNPKRIIVANFGGPRTGDAKFAAAFETLKLDVRRYTFYQDVVPKVLPRTFGFAHTAGEIHIKENSIIQCEGREDPTCANAFVDVDADAHHHLFDVKFFFSNRTCETPTPPPFNPVFPEPNGLWNFNRFRPPFN